MATFCDCNLGFELRQNILAIWLDYIGQNPIGILRTVIAISIRFETYRLHDTILIFIYTKS